MRSLSGNRRERLDHRSLFAKETGSCKQKWKDKLPVALLFPNTYQLGMSNLGFQLVYARLNQCPGLVCERFFRSDDQAQPLSIESNRPLKDFPIVLVSVSFEDDFLTVIDLLRRGGIPPEAGQRRRQGPVAPGTPLVVGGGVATCINPEPLAPCMDLFLLGEFEPVAEPFLAHLLAIMRSGPLAEHLRAMAQTLPGCYVPSFYQPLHGEDGRLQGWDVAPGIPARVRRNVHAGGPVAGHSHILTEETEFANIHLVELGRGCSRGCRFCAAGYVYRPPRLWRPEAIGQAIATRPASCQKVGLLGMEMARPDDVQALSEMLLAESCRLSFSSLRADVIRGPLLDLLARSELKTAVIAPDGGSERLRRVINKGITREDCLHAAADLARAGIFTLKLYFMIGLPTETMADLAEMLQLVRDIQATVMDIGRPRGRICRLALSVNCFVPKAWTPFQFAPFAPLEELKAKIKFLRQGLAACHHIQLSVDQPDKALFQATLARGDRRVGEALLALNATGGNWRQAFRKTGVDPDDHAGRGREQDETLPWEIVEHGISRAFLWHEYQQALAGKTSRACEIADNPKCRRCGVCHD